MAYTPEEMAKVQFAQNLAQNLNLTQAQREAAINNWVYAPPAAPKEPPFGIEQLGSGIVGAAKKVGQAVGNVGNGIINKVGAILPNTASVSPVPAPIEDQRAIPIARPTSYENPPAGPLEPNASVKQINPMANKPIVAPTPLTQNIPPMNQPQASVNAIAGVEKAQKQRDNAEIDAQAVQLNVDKARAEGLKKNKERDDKAFAEYETAKKEADNLKDFKDPITNMSLGKTMGFIMASAFAGLGGAGAVSNMINGIYSRALSTQKANYDKTREKARDQWDYYTKMKEKGASDLEISLAGESAILKQANIEIERLKTKVEDQFKLTQLDNLQKQLQVQQKNADINGMNAITDRSYKQGVLEMQHENNLVDLAKAQLSAKSQNRLPQGAAENIIKMDQTMDSLKAFAARPKPNMAVAGITKHLPGEYSGDAWNREAVVIWQNVGTALEGGKLTDKDRDYYNKDLKPTATDTEAQAKAKILGMHSLLERNRGVAADFYKQQGYNVPDYKTDVSSFEAK